jgi:arylsulfatase A-like enzyme
MAGDNVTMAEMLQQAGYATGICGKWHLGDKYPMRPQDQGFEESLIHKSGGIGQTPDKPNSYQDPALWKNGRPFQAEGYCTDVFFDAAAQFIEDKQDQPFFVYLPVNAPHTPLEISDQAVAPYRQAGLDETTARVYAMVENIDTNLGRLLKHLDRLELRDDTVVFFIGDNGPQQKRFNDGLRGRKSWVYEGSIRVPCFVQWPKVIAGGRVDDTIAAHIDIAPTLLQICGATGSMPMDGASLLPVLRQLDTEPLRQRRLFFQCHRGLKPQRYQNCAVVTQAFKLVGYPGTFSDEQLQVSQTAPRLELYDLSKDRREARDLADTYPEITAELRTAYNQWFDDVSATRHFTPGTIVIDPEHESPIVLCRYQDGDYLDGFSNGWDVRVARTERFRISVKREEVSQQDEAAGHVMMGITWQNATHTVLLPSGHSDVEFSLAAGQGTLDIWTQPVGQPRQRPGNNSTVGDVTLVPVER